MQFLAFQVKTLEYLVKLNSHMEEILRRTAPTTSNDPKPTDFPRLPLLTFEELDNFNKWLKIGQNSLNTVLSAYLCTRFDHKLLYKIK